MVRRPSPALPVPLALVAALVAGAADAVVDARGRPPRARGPLAHERAPDHPRRHRIARAAMRSVVGSAMQNSLGVLRPRLGRRNGRPRSTSAPAHRLRRRLGNPLDPGARQQPRRTARSRTSAAPATSDLATMEASPAISCRASPSCWASNPAELVLNPGRSGQPPATSGSSTSTSTRERPPDRRRARRLPRQQRQPDPVRHREPAGPAPRASPSSGSPRAAARRALGELPRRLLGERRDRRPRLAAPAADRTSEQRVAEGYASARAAVSLLVWQFTFRRDGEMGTWRGRVDATTGEVVEFCDVNDYGSATGGAYRNDRPASEACCRCRSPTSPAAVHQLGRRLLRHHRPPRPSTAST